MEVNVLHVLETFVFPLLWQQILISPHVIGRLMVARHLTDVTEYYALFYFIEIIKINDLHCQLLVIIYFVLQEAVLTMSTWQFIFTIFYCLNFPSSDDSEEEEDDEEEKEREEKNEKEEEEEEEESEEQHSTEECNKRDSACGGTDKGECPQSKPHKGTSTSPT